MMTNQEIKPTKRKYGLAQLNGVYGGYYMAVGAFVPFINLYYSRLGLKGMEIGILATIPVIISSTITFLWSVIADKYQLHRIMMLLSIFLSVLAVIALSFMKSFETLIPFVIIYAVLSCPFMPLLDSLALEVAEINKISYGNLRIWGTIGWALSTLIVGVLVDRFNIVYIFYSFITFMIITFFLSIFLPPRRQTMSSTLIVAFKQLFSRSELYIFLTSVFVVSTTVGAANSFWSIFLDRLGASEAMIGFTWTLSALCEIPVMYGSGFFIKHFSAESLIKISFFAYAIYWFLISKISDPSIALISQVLQGFAFSTFLIGGVTITNSFAPNGMSTTTQSLFNIVVFGLGSISGNLIGGFFYEELGLSDMFHFLFVITLIVSIVFCVIYETPKNSKVPKISFL